MAILENINNFDTLFQKKNIGFFLGSFDPIHEGHINTILEVLNQNLSDCVIIYCVNGNSLYKNRSSFFERTKLCEEIFKNYKNVFVSYLSPQQLQQKLKIHATFSAIIGSDIAINLNIPSNSTIIEKHRTILKDKFMTRQNISGITDSIACSFIAQADNFIVSIRDNDCIIPNKIANRNIAHIISNNTYKNISSTKIRS